MQLRDTRLLLVILGVSKSNLQRTCSSTAAPKLDLYDRATSPEGLLSIYKYWGAHSSTYSKLPALAVLDPGSCPRGLTPALLLELLSRLTDLQQWQIWELWTMLDTHSCGFVGCAEFTLLVVLLCAGAAQQHLQAVHAYAGSICSTFLGAHVGSCYEGLCQCCRLMGLPVSGLITALEQQQQQQQWRHAAGAGQGSSCCSSSSSVTTPALAQQAAAPRNGGSHCGSSRSSSKQAQTPCAAATAAAASTPATAASLGCCCHQSPGIQPSGQQQQQWACGAAAHRQHMTALPRGLAAGGGCRAPRLPHAGTLLSTEDMELVLCQVVTEQARWQAGSSTPDEEPEQLYRGCLSCCTIC